METEISSPVNSASVPRVEGWYYNLAPSRSISGILEKEPRQYPGG